MPEGQKIAPVQVQKKENMNSTQLVDISKNCGPTATEVDGFKDLMHQYANRMSVSQSVNPGNQAEWSRDMTDLRNSAAGLRDRISHRA